VTTSARKRVRVHARWTITAANYNFISITTANTLKTFPRDLFVSREMGTAKWWHCCVECTAAFVTQDLEPSAEYKQRGRRGGGE